MNVDKSDKKDDMAPQQVHRGRVAVAGPATGESYSFEGSDEEGGWGGNSGYAIQVRWHRWYDGADNSSSTTTVVVVSDLHLCNVLRRCACVRSL